MTSQIRIFGARQNNLKNLDVAVNTGELLVITGVSGSGKSSLAFDTLYAEGQRRYVETFSPYARQFLDRMDKPQVERIEGILPAIAIDQVNPVRNSRSTVGTMTELNDHLKLLFARLGRLYCQCCGQPVLRDNAESIRQQLAVRTQAEDPRLVVTFPIVIPANYTEEEVRGFLEQQGYTRIHHEETRLHTPSSRSKGKKGKAAATKPEKLRVLHVIQDRFRFGSAETGRVMEALDTALKQGDGHVAIHVIPDDASHANGGAPLDAAKAPESPPPAEAAGANGLVWRFSSRLHCAQCDIEYATPLPSTFSFNSPLGACESCRGFGRVMGIDYGLVVPDTTKTLRGGALRPWQTASYKECQTEMEQYAPKAGVRLDVPWQDLTDDERRWVIDGAPDWKGGPQAWKHQWYGAQRFFDWLESRAYKMHVRVLLSKYRSYTPCPACGGARLKPDATLWRIGDETAAAGDGSYPRFMPVHATWTRAQLDAMPGLGIHDLMRLPIERVRDYFQQISFGQQMDAALDLLLTEVRTRLKFLCDVGLGYLSLDRQSRTLSGGEVQRINLTTALGTSLVNTLFVLDEPSIGLHPRDMHRVVEVMHRLRANGNTLVVVEHDPQVMIAADRIMDIGPGPGERGGHIVFDGTPEQLRHAETLTGNYLGGRLRVEAPRPMPVASGTPRLLLEGVRANNLKNISVSIPLGRLVCITGVSGSGKSTLVQDVLYPAMLKHQGKPTEAPGPFDRLLGAEQLAGVVMVDQTPIGKTARSNPASYVGAFDPIRKLFANAPTAKERGYTAGTFSFNTGDGRCPTCGGTGFEHVEMQFLSDVYLRCPDCDGKRFRPEILEVRVEHMGRSASIADVLEMTITEALAFFQGLRDVQWALSPLADVGLEYVRLGQPVPTLSGGEAQRLKLAGHLAEAARSGISSARVAKKGSLFLFDEPTTGLHFDDVAKLMRAFRKLLAAGHSLLIIEHNLDVIRAADWLIDLGPEGGDMGGELVGAGTPETLARNPDSHTGRALADYTSSIVYEDKSQQARKLAEPAVAYGDDTGKPLQSILRRRRAGKNSIDILNAREHNLKGVNVSIPRDTFTVITGVSGSGKSTLAFDILFNEGQRRYLESLNAYARAIVQPAGKPDVDAIYGIPPTVAIEQRTSRGGRKSTVATMTEIHHFLRLLYVKLGTQMCPTCNIAVQPQTADQIVAQILSEYRGRHIGILAPLVTARKGYYTDLAKWAGGKGYTHLRVDGAFIPVSPWPRLDRYREHTLELPVADLLVDPREEAALRNAVRTALEHGQGTLTLLADLTDGASPSLNDRRAAGLAHVPQQRQFSVRRACPSCGTSFPEPDPRMFSYNSKHGWCASCFGTGLQLAGFDAEQTGEEITWNAWYEGSTEPCRACNGERLNPVSRAFRWRDRSIAQFAAMPVSEAQSFFTGLISRGREADIARDILSEIRGRLNFMQEVGLGYLALDRAAPTLSGGEAQRIRLAAQLGSNLQGVCYVLDEPTIGLHARDNQILLNALARLEGNGNTLVVVEHDEDTIRRASHIIDIGPGAGVRGGMVVAQGTAQEIMDNAASVTGRYLREPLPHPLRARRPIDAGVPMITVHNAHMHNLRNVQASVPIGRLSVVTGVSGSGKSTLAREVLLDNLALAVSAGRAPAWRGCTGIEGWKQIDRVLEVDQTPIGKTPRSCPATYVGFWDDVRKLFAGTREARLRGWAAARFSFNTGDGRCPVCEGQGMRTLEMSFLPDVKVPCDACNGERFSRDTLNVAWRGKSAGEVLKMEVDDAVSFFSAHSKILRPLQLMQDVGLGYLTLGQPSPTLSGGEAQRIKLVTELAKARLTDGVIKTGRASRIPHTLYVLDEPTVGLSSADVEKLIHVLHRLVDAGNTVVVIEHNLDIIAEADWVLDLGPEGGTGGGRLVAQGSPESIMANPQSHTGAALAQFMRGHACTGQAGSHAAAPLGEDDHASA
ncbi:excinuclease ABC subunit A [Allopusillimonas soli]|uniref:UvrABC system protein A n=1 Tax=Allopusillimonas soli TaxID=659016 RepID=A0A853F805_9BURK|nr:excinuclease ABC subunit UvrA [Allopusillimonas soli]NYT35672.1 excinuclease ABC subunit UvrA [Allopusillimonas soli]TEA76065.1 excinuclease ABC subunit A [Allopusillimonas soli]